MSSDPPINTKWFRDQLADRGMSQRSLARLINLDPAALSLMLRGRRAMKLEEAGNIARLLGVPVAEVLHHAGVEISSLGASVAITGWLDPHGEVHFEPDLGEVDRPHDLPSDVTAIQCRTAGSDLDYMDGWLLYVSKPSQPVATEHIGRLCLVRIAAGVVYLAQLRRGYRPARWNIAGPVAHANDVALDWSAAIVMIRT